MLSELLRFKILITLLLSFGVYLCYIITASGVLDPGDGITHYQIARYAPMHPELYLHHWGKPLFTLLGSLLAQIGFQGMMVFNCLLGLLTAYLTYRVAAHLKISASWMVIVFTLFSPVYFYVILAGHTEVLFSLLLISSIYCVLINKYLVAALIISFLPFSRTEGFFILLLFAVLFVFNKQYRFLPWLAVGTLLYSLAGWLVFDDLLWLVTHNPYTGAAEIYGQGDLWHFFRNYRAILGNPLVFMFVLGILVFLIQLITSKGWKSQDHLNTGLLVLGPLLIVLAMHSYFWWKGLYGSLGLVRVMASVIPCMVLICLWGIDFIDKQLLRKIGKIRYVVLVIYLGLIVYVPLKTTAFPLGQTSRQQLIQQAVDWFSTTPYTDEKIYYMHPYLAFKLEIDPFDEKKVGTLWDLDMQAPGKNLAANTIIFWDGAFGPNEAHRPLEIFEKDATLTRIKSFVPQQPIKEIGDNVFEIHVFRKDSI